MDPNNPNLRVQSKESLRVLGSLGSDRLASDRDGLVRRQKDTDS
jgi:hypothetical protein